MATVILGLLTPVGVRAEAGGLSASSSAPPPDGPVRNYSPRTAEEFWIRAERELLAGIELTESQREQIGAILVEAAQDRLRFAEAQEALEQARQEGNMKRARELSEEVKEIRQGFNPSTRIARMRTVLTEEQRESFDRNRRLRGDRMLAERRAARTRASPQQPATAQREGAVGRGTP